MSVEDEQESLLGTTVKNCSYCGQENEDAAIRCSGCGVDFESSTAADDDAPLRDPTLSLVIVGTYRNVVDAGMAKMRLEAGGIESCIPEEYTPQLFWYAIPSPLETVTVRVAAKDYETARQILTSDA